MLIPWKHIQNMLTVDVTSFQFPCDGRLYFHYGLLNIPNECFRMDEERKKKGDIYKSYSNKDHSTNLPSEHFPVENMFMKWLGSALKRCSKLVFSPTFWSRWWNSWTLLHRDFAIQPSKDEFVAKPFAHCRGWKMSLISNPAIEIPVRGQGSATTLPCTSTSHLFQLVY